MNETNSSFEETLKKIEAITRDLERGQTTLEDSMLQFQKGIQYLQHCYQLLENAEEKLEVILKDASGNFVAKEIQSLQDLENLKKLEDKLNSI
ncbi:MAG: exodeoxyribonuclease VII small subunit [Planctomycetota bacterium]